MVSHTHLDCWSWRAPTRNLLSYQPKIIGVPYGPHNRFVKLENRLGVPSPLILIKFDAMTHHNPNHPSQWFLICLIPDHALMCSPSQPQWPSKLHAIVIAEVQIYSLCQIPITYYSLARTNINGSKQKYGTTMLSFLINHPWIPSTLVGVVVFFYGGTLFHQQFPPLIALARNEEIPLYYSWSCSQSGPHRAAVHPPNKEVICGVYSFGNITHICLHIQSLGASEIHMTTFFLLVG
jgi:hypothetical protein